MVQEGATGSLAPTGDKGCVQLSLTAGEGPIGWRAIGLLQGSHDPMSGR
jgi:hypothetical protein